MKSEAQVIHEIYRGQEMNFPTDNTDPTSWATPFREAGRQWWKSEGLQLARKHALLGLSEMPLTMLIFSYPESFREAVSKAAADDGFKTYIDNRAPHGMGWSLVVSWLKPVK